MTAERRLWILHLDPGQASLAQALAQYGFAVREFQSPDELLAGNANEAPDALICVAHAGDLDEARLGAFRAAHPGAHCVVVCASGGLDQRIAAVRLGMEGFFAPPFDPALLVDRLDNLLRDEAEDAPSVLVVEDSPAQAAFIGAVLGQAGMLPRVVTDPMQVWDVLGEFQPELILMDMYMPGCTGEELAKVIRQQPAWLSVPIVYLSAETDANRQQAAMSLGGDDFLTKPIAPERLIAAVWTRVRRYRSLRALMVRDSLTGLLNHTTVKERLHLEVLRAQRHARPLAFAMVDIDHFKKVNDTWGHPAGDRVIKNLSRLLSQRLRATDIVGRYGGEEFAVVLPETTADNAVAVMNNLRESFAALPQGTLAQPFQATFSCGIAALPDHASAKALTEAADAALYEAKRGGRNRVAGSRSPESA
jgi:diguanylate cyclase (GGDEF)-like protein